MNYYLVRAKWGDIDKADKFIKNNYWENGHDDKYLDLVKSIKPNDILLLADGSYIRYVAKCTENKNDGKKIVVDKWRKLNKPITFPGKGAYRKTITSINQNKYKELIINIENILDNNFIINYLKVENFMSLPNEKIYFNKTNIFIGKNGSGKSQIIKLIYSLILSNNEIEKIDYTSEYEKQRIIANNLIDIFKADKLGNLVNYNHKEAVINIDFGIYNLDFKFSSSARKEVNKVNKDSFNFNTLFKESVFIPTKEILSFFKGFRILYEDRDLEFDKTYYELARTLERTLLKENKLNDIQNKLEKILNGKVEIENGKFYLLTNDNKKLEINLLAEGLRKIAMLSYLIANGSLTNSSILFWDEPESNMHPQLIDDIVQFLAILANRGMQIFITTHSPYVIESFNNHLKKYKIKDKRIDDIEIRNLEPLNPEDVKAYLLEDEKITSLINKEFGLIDDKLLNEFNKISLIYEKMRDIEWEENE